MNSNAYMNFQLCEDAINQIKDFPEYYYKLTEEQEAWIDVLIPNKALNERCKKYRLCKECSQPNTGIDWCQSCNSKHFQREFINWTSENKEIDEFIQKFQLNATCREEVFEWIPYNKFRFINYHRDEKGGFDTTLFTEEWINGDITSWNIDRNKWNRGRNVVVVLKHLNNSQNLSTDFLRRITFYKEFINERIVPFYGISQDPKTKNFVMVTKYMHRGSLGQYNFDNLNLYDKLCSLEDITYGLKGIHNKGIIHKNFHSGNVLKGSALYFISDLGLCKPANEDNERNVYGVLPYVAPEVLRGERYTQSADIYSFGIVACEILTKLPPFHDLPHGEYLALNICQGLRPRFDYNDVVIPRLWRKLIDQCLDADPLKRPTADKLHGTFSNWKNEVKRANYTEFYDQYQDAVKFHKIMPVAYEKHPQAIYTSRLLNYKNLPEPQNSEIVNDNYLDIVEYSALIAQFDG